MTRFTVGLTGGIGSGKSAVAERFAARGVPVIDTDAIAHELTRAGGAAIGPLRAAFGDDVLTADGALDRARMRRLAFDEPAARAKLEAILHPLIRARVAELARALAGDYLIVVVPLLVESGAAGSYARVLVVDCPEAQQIARVTRRSGLSEAEVRAIMAAQASRAERLARADDVIDNSGPLQALDAQVERLHRQYLALAAKFRTAS